MIEAPRNNRKIELGIFENEAMWSRATATCFNPASVGGGHGFRRGWLAINPISSSGPEST